MNFVTARHAHVHTLNAICIHVTISVSNQINVINYHKIHRIRLPSRYRWIGMLDRNQIKNLVIVWISHIDYHDFVHNVLFTSPTLIANYLNTQ